MESLAKMTSSLLERTGTAFPSTGGYDARLCADLEDNVTRTINGFNVRHQQMRSHGNNGGSSSIHVDVARAINDFGVPIVAVFGIVGNALNLAVLTRKRLQRTMADRLERSAHAGLVALAASDALVCLTFAAASFLLRADRAAAVYGRDQSLATLYFDVYREPLLNVFLLSSTWLTVVMAVERYVAVCRPLHARGFISLTGTRVAIAAVFGASLAFNAPRFWHYVAAAKPCAAMLPAPLRAVAAEACAATATGGGCRYYVKETGSLYAEHATFVRVYGIVYFVVDILLPLPVLTFCNVCLVLALRRSRRLQQQQQQPSTSSTTMTTTSGRVSVGTTATAAASVRSVAASSGVKSSHDRLTRTLIGLILLLTFLVGPSEVLAFFREFVLSGGGGGSTHRYVVYRTATSVTNFMLLVNYAVNFVLYCVVNANFRRTCWDLVACRCVMARRRRRGSAGGGVGGVGTTGLGGDGCRSTGVGFGGGCRTSVSGPAAGGLLRGNVNNYELVVVGGRNDITGGSKNKTGMNRDFVAAVDGGGVVGGGGGGGRRRYEDTVVTSVALTGLRRES